MNAIPTMAVRLHNIAVQKNIIFNGIFVRTVVLVCLVATIATAHRVNLVVNRMINVPYIVLENPVATIVTVHPVNRVVMACVKLEGVIRVKVGLVGVLQ